MANRHFRQLLESRWADGQLVCVGLDPVESKIETIFANTIKPSDFVNIFLKKIVDSTHDLVAAYKPNRAFFTRPGGMVTLRNIIAYIHKVAPAIPVILDCKVGDIGNSNLGYIEEVFEYFNADACTVNGSLGQDTWQSLLDRPEKGVLALCRTSNSGAAKNYDQQVVVPWTEWKDLHANGAPDNGNWQTTEWGILMPKHEHIALDVAYNWNSNNNCGLVVGATAPEQLANVRGLAPNITILAPGIGTQGGDLEQTIRRGARKDGGGLIVNSSSAVLYKSSGPDFDLKARNEVEIFNISTKQALIKEVSPC